MANSIISKINKSYFGIEGTFAIWFVLTGIATQILTWYLMNDSMLSLYSGIAGVISVVLCSQKKYAFYFWGLIQLITIIVISVQSGLYGKILENLFYLVTMFIGMFLWSKKLTDTRTMNKIDYGVFCLFIAPLCFWAAFTLTKTYNSGHVLLDTITTTIGMVAQMMLILRFREQWILWFILDVLCIILWAKTGNWCLVAQYIFWTINCIYGYFYWRYAKN